MLTLDLLRLSEAEVRGIVAAQCANFGTGAVLRIALPDDRHGQGAAVVKMSTYEEASRLVSELGGSRCGSKVILRLLQQGAAVPSALTRNQDFDAAAEEAYEDQIAT
jgi:hypothetical protein